MSEHMGTTCVQGGYRPGDAEPRQIPIYQSTTWKYDTSEHMGKRNLATSILVCRIRPTTMLLRRFARWRAALLQC